MKKDYSRVIVQGKQVQFDGFEFEELRPTSNSKTYVPPSTQIMIDAVDNAIVQLMRAKRTLRGNGNDKAIIASLGSHGLWKEIEDSDLILARDFTFDRFGHISKKD